MNGLVLEGGTFRPIFSSGVMDALLTEDIMLPYCIGVSAGIADGVSYISKQKGILILLQNTAMTNVTWDLEITANRRVFLDWILSLVRFRTNWFLLIRKHFSLTKEPAKLV